MTARFREPDAALRAAQAAMERDDAVVTIDVDLNLALPFAVEAHGVVSR